MSRKQGCSVQVHGDHWTAAAVTSTARRAWRVDHLAHGPSAARPPAELIRAWSGAQERTAWLLPDAEARTALLTVPALKGKALALAVRGMVARDEGGAPEDWAVTWRPGGERERGARDVFAVFAGRADLERHLAAAADWGRPPGLLLPSHLALEQFYRRHGPDGDAGDAWNLVYLGGRDRFLCVSTRTGVLLMRNLPEDLSAGRDPAEYLDRVATEVERSVFFAKQTEHSPQIERIVVCGEAEAARGLIERLDRQSLAPCLHWDMAGGFDWGDRTPGADDLPALAAAVLALDDQELNLAPRKSRTSLSPRFRRRLLVGAGAAAAAAVPILLVSGLLTARVQRDYLLRARRELDEAMVRAGDAERVYRAQRVLLARETLITRFAAGRPDLESLLRRLAAVTPKQVVFRDLRIEAGDDGAFVLHLAGESLAATGEEAQAAFLTFLAALRGSGFVDVPPEPSQMHMEPWHDEDTEGRRTLFRLDLPLVTPPAEGE